MTGIFLIVLVAIWLWACVAMTRAVTRRIPASAWRALTALMIFLAMLISPVIDEIVGGFQFRALCEKNAVLQIGVEHPEGRTTRFSADPTNAIVPGTVIPIYDTGVNYTDVATGERVVAFHKYVAKGGVLIQNLGISESNSPITMGRHFCSPENIRGEAIHRTLKFSVVN
jgi:hypothetical protein